MGAYYSRANSYSRSYNAEEAEGQYRYPKSRCWSEIKALINKGTTEWHHVGKYASRIDYYDMASIAEIVLNAQSYDPNMGSGRHHKPLRTWLSQQERAKFEKEKEEKINSNDTLRELYKEGIFFEVSIDCDLEPQALRIKELVDKMRANGHLELLKQSKKRDFEHFNVFMVDGVFVGGYDYTRSKSLNKLAWKYCLRYGYKETKWKV